MTKYPSPADILEMKTRGYDPSTIAAAEEQSRRWTKAERICDMIRKAFADVTLGNGVGLRETRALDDYEDEGTCAAVRAGDEKEDWQRISLEELNRYEGLAFFDAEGMRFHLPALLIADLQAEYIFGMTGWLTELSDHSRSQFTLLSDAQRRAVRAYLLFLLDDPEEELHRADIQRALNDYWTCPG